MSVAGRMAGERSRDEGILSLPSASKLRASRARRKCIGNVLPRFLARRRIPRAAVGLKKNRGGAWGSKTSDNEQTVAALGDSEKLAVKHTPRHPIPAGDHENAQDFRKVSSLVTTEKSGNILENKPSGSKLAQDSRKVVKEARALPREARAEARDTNILAGDARGDEVNGRKVVPAAFSDVVKSLGVREASFEDRPAERLFFDLPDCFPARSFKAKVKPSNSGEK